MSTARTLDRGAATGTCWLLVAAGCALLAVRPSLVAATDHPTAVLGAVFAVLTVAGLAMPVPATVRRVASSPSAAVLLCGIVVFGIGRALAGGRAIEAASITAVLTNSFAAVAEEVWFRRVVYGWLAPAGTSWAIVGSAVLFGLVHVTTYGIGILPLDIAAGLVLAWQRAATGSWRVPALTHVVANLLALW